MAAANSFIAGPYVAPSVRAGDVLSDAIDGDVEVGGYSDAPLPWPRRKKSGRHSLILCDDLVRAVKTESSEAVQYWFGVSAVTVWKWRVALGVDRQNNTGTQKLYRDLMPSKLTPKRTAKGRETIASTDAVERMTATKRGKPAHPNTKAALLKAAKAPKPEGWGKRANQWMRDGKKSRGSKSASDSGAITRAVFSTESGEHLREAYTEAYERAAELHTEASEILRAAARDPEVRSARSRAMKEAWADPDVRNARLEGIREESKRNAMSERMKQVYSDPEVRAKMVAATTAGKRTPEARAKRSKIQKERLATPEARDKLKAAAKRRFADPDARAAMSDKIKAFYARKRAAEKE